MCCQDRGGTELFGDRSDLLARLHATISADDEARPLAVLAGSGLTLPAIPGVNEIINVVRNLLPPDDQAELDNRLRRLVEPGLKYQEAFMFLSRRRPPALRDRIITVCTLKAYRKKLDTQGDFAPDKLTQYEADVDSWNIPPGLESLGRVWVGLPPRLRGPIVTTNFDPLCEVAIQKAGGSVIPRVMDSDGSFMRDVRASANIWQVIHLHGYWRQSSTLSMTTQLTQDRPALEGSIRTLLNQYTLLVLGYGAWNDALSRQLVRIVRGHEARDLDILWCYYRKPEELDKECETNDVLGTLRQAPGNVQFYTDIDVNDAIPALERKLAGLLTFSDSTRRKSGHETLVDWLPVSNSVAVAPTGDEGARAAITFFDGRLPNWHDAVNPLLPRRDVVRALHNELKEFIRLRQSSLMLITGASGEGKTTALMQTAALVAAGSPELVTLFNGEGRISSVDDIMRLPASTSYLLVIDDAYLSIERLRDLVVQINGSGRTGLHLLLASRDTDWSSVGGFTFTWARYVSAKTYNLRGISRPDAAAMIQSWERLGAEALGRLALLPDTEQRISALMDAAVDHRVAKDGAFLGALLMTRYGDGLIDHIRELLVRLSGRQIYRRLSEIDDNLLHAFFVIALPHAAGVRAMNAPVLARILGMAEQEVYGTVILPLGDEAAVAFDSENILIRHTLIAKAACDLSADLGVDLNDVAMEVVRAAVAEVEERGVHPNVLQLAYLSQRLDDPAMAVIAAQAAVEAAPRRLSFRTSLSRALRVSGDARSAVRVAEEGLAMITDSDDILTGVRPMFTEWGVAEGYLGNWARNAVLASVSLQDMDAWGDPREDQLTTAVSCLALALRKLWESSRSFDFLNGLAGAADIGLRLDDTEHYRKRIREAEEIAFNNGAAQPRDLADAIANLAEACGAALARIESPFPLNMPAQRFRFEGLKSATHA
jgi:hypothetical protein